MLGHYRLKEVGVQAQRRRFDPRHLHDARPQDPVLNGAEFRYLRSHLRLSQNALAKLPGNTAQSAANWEKRGRFPLWADKHMRILWQASQEGQRGGQNVVLRLNDGERLLNQRIIVKETARGWSSRIEDGVAA